MEFIFSLMKLIREEGTTSKEQVVPASCQEREEEEVSEAGSVSKVPVDADLLQLKVVGRGKERGWKEEF